VDDDLLTSRLRLRRPTPADRDFHAEVHSDPRLYGHAPHVRQPDPVVNESVLRSWLEHWDREGFGYRLVEDRETGEPVGWAGVRRDTDHLNLYYRFRAESHGRGLGREAASAVVAHATETGPRLPVRAVVRPGHEASLRTASSAGLLPVATVRHRDDPPEGPDSVVLEAPMVTRETAFSDGDRSAVLTLWKRVTDAGGAVGFTRGADVSHISEALTSHEGQMSAGEAVAGVLRSPGGDVLGIAWWVRVPTPLMAHVRWLFRFMVDPDLWGRNLGRLLMCGLHRIARGDGVEIALLGYRSGTGVSRFYARNGYVEVGRNPGTIRVGPGDDRDDVTMSRRLDGRPLTSQGGS
jgi:RimJ/RimL family protein N-acetyltransferase/ribosomal protein S18 acetylase RimI-like enzyme